MKFKRLATILMAAAMMVSLVACTGDNGENSETPVTSGNDVVEETEANHITLAESWGFENFYTIMTPDVSASNFGITYYLSNFYDVLVEYQDGEYVGGLAEDWKISEDGTVYTFNLRHDVKFSDGSDLTAEDVAKSLLAVPINLGQYNGTYGRLSTIIEDAVVVDDYTVEMHLTQPYYNALRELCLANPFGIVSSEQLNDDLTKKDTFETATYGTGPYMYVGDNDGQTWNFESNPYYWGEKPDVESFSIESIPDNDAKILALKNGEIDFVAGITNVSNESFVEMQNTEGFGAKVDDKSFRTGYIGYNLSSSMFGDEVVRQAITLALDKDAISESIYGGLYEKADTFFPKTLPYCDVEQTVYSYDIDRANQLLDEAGYIDTDGDGIREKDGEKLSSPFQYQAGSASDDNLVVYICDQLGKIGIELTPQSAQMITLGGIDVKTVEPEVLLKNYAIVFQNVTLFDESVMENIRLGRSGASDEDVRAAAKAAQCDEFIDRLPQGYDTNIGENGSKLSGGERQRISIARALLKNAPVILLDEATASMDAESETMVQTALSALLKGRTVIVIAHRMRTIANADKIVVLDKGKVTEVGTPSELAKKGGLYAHLVALQQKQQMSSLPT